ncbi:Uncharacterized protein APZ42_012587 [Daphnia magna]|uniref:Uncharacterized protein n=1 Tax=Daphnia magna TaxID=35525 RepID=A0A162RN54_9CRUS|nr:Uncharacterized protein APZ42_012587 [Daphnia magna]
MTNSDFEEHAALVEDEEGGNCLMTFDVLTLTFYEGNFRDVYFEVFFKLQFFCLTYHSMTTTRNHTNVIIYCEYLAKVAITFFPGLAQKPNGKHFWRLQAEPQLAVPGYQLPAAKRVRNTLIPDLEETEKKSDGKTREKF